MLDQEEKELYLGWTVILVLEWRSSISSNSGPAFLGS